MTTDLASTPQVNLNPADATERVNTDVYQVKTSEFRYASDEYMAKADPGAPRPLQWHIEWLGLSFRFDNQEDPSQPPTIQRSLNVTDKNGATAFWGTKDPEPGPKDSYPLQLSKYFAKLGLVLGSDPSVINGMTFVCENKTLQAGAGTPVNVLVPIARFEGPFTGELRIVKTKQGQAQSGNGTGPAAAPAISDDQAWAALAGAMDGKNVSELVNVALQTAEVAQTPSVLGVVAGGKGRPELEKLGSVDDAGVFTKAAS